MIFKKKYLLLVFSIIIIFQSYLYINNKQTTSFRYFKWTLQEVSLGKLISISFFSGLFISTLLNTSINNTDDNTLKNMEKNNEFLNDEEDLKSNVEIPPQRDIRDAQPTISVNYRVIKNTEENYLKKNKNLSNNSDINDDWDNDNNDW